ncbi:MAG: hypothetical protein CME70_11160 [Halobacteriovorax sp.]|nr:hypothetical protein [Halobacteriovorax sp.]|tara:strand:- start:12492 stop:12908 length:417 start_codon:yes stop_codon:yes gene_type:complete
MNLKDTIRIQKRAFQPFIKRRSVMAKKKRRRSDTKKITKEALILRYMRESRHLSMRKAAKVIGISEAKINHSENGRRDLKPDYILKVVVALGYSYQDFLDFLNDKKDVPEHTLSECIEILKRLTPDKLKTVRTILESF